MVVVEPTEFHQELWSRAGDRMNFVNRGHVFLYQLLIFGQGSIVVEDGQAVKVIR